MRLILKLNCIEGQTISCNYFYPLSASVYNLLKLGSPEFSEFLHKKGYRTDAKKFELYAFALKFEEFKVIRDKIILKSPRAFLTISSPLIEDFIDTFLTGSLGNKFFELNCGGTDSVFIIEGIEKYYDPKFTDNMKFSALSPIVLSGVKEENGQITSYYFRYSDDMKKFNENLNKNLIEKYELIFGKTFLGGAVKLDWDWNYINKRSAERKNVTMKQTIGEHDPDQIEIIGNMSPFKVTGAPELIKIGYECGFGEKNSLGFGLAKVIIPKNPTDEIMKNAYIFPKNAEQKKTQKR